MIEIYEVGTPNSFSIFALFSQIDDPLTFEQVVEEVWEQAMDEEIECEPNMGVGRCTKR